MNVFIPPPNSPHTDSYSPFVNSSNAPLPNELSPTNHLTTLGLPSSPKESQHHTLSHKKYMKVPGTRAVRAAAPATLLKLEVTSQVTWRVAIDATAPVDPAH